MRKTSMILAVALFCAPVFAEDGKARLAKRLWKASIAAVAAGSAMDLQSSFGKHETNSLLANQQGVFSAQSAVLKLAIAGAALGTEEFLLRRHPSVSGYRTGAFLNLAVAGALTGVAIHNYTVPAVH
jgi:hypothetical protein